MLVPIPNKILLFQRINYAKRDSDAIAKMKGTFVERIKKPKAKPEEIDVHAKKRKAKQQR